jgi:hypothetical protein
MFYKNKIKIIPLNLSVLLTSRSLAYWYMDDGSKEGPCYSLATCCFSVEDHILFEKIFL